MSRKLFRSVIVASALMTSFSAWAHDGDHSYTNGICTIDGCTDKYQAPTQDTDGYFMIVNESDGLDAASQKFEKIIDGMKTYTVEQIEEALKAAGFSKIKTDHHRSKPWITVIARKELESYEGTKKAIGIFRVDGLCGRA